MVRFRFSVAMILVVLASGLLNPGVMTSEAEPPSPTPVAMHRAGMVVIPVNNPEGDLLVGLPDPPRGSEYDTAPYLLEVPAGVCWKLESISYHITSSTNTAKRNTKVVFVDLSDTEGNVGRVFVKFGQNFGANVYLDNSGFIGGAESPSIRGSGASESNLLITHDNNALPSDLCWGEGFGWGTVTDQRDSDPDTGDSFSEFWAVVRPEAVSGGSAP